MCQFEVRALYTRMSYEKKKLLDPSMSWSFFDKTDPGSESVSKGNQKQYERWSIQHPELSDSEGKRSKGWILKDAGVILGILKDWFLNLVTKSSAQESYPQKSMVYSCWTRKKFSRVFIFFSVQGTFSRVSRP